jgi:glycosyltransferase involved in cell wall biosynthesis
MNDSFNPEMSVVLVTPDDYETIRKTIKHLQAQTVREKLEIVIVAPSEKTLNLNESELQEFSRFRVVEVGEINSHARARAIGIRHATAPIVALTEDHSYPDPSWAEALIRAHEKPWAAVGPVMRNANPQCAISCANLLIEYGPWLDPAPSGKASHLPGHNSSYKREILLGYGPELESMLESESIMHWDLRSRGFEIYLEQAAKTNHMNISLLSSWTVVQFLNGRVFASARSKNWSPIRRAVYAGGFPLIPLIRLYRIILDISKQNGLYNIGFLKKLRISLALVLGLVIDGVGQFVGYSLGAGDSEERLSKYEFHRYLHLSKSDKKILIYGENESK